MFPFPVPGPPSLLCNVRVVYTDGSSDVIPGVYVKTAEWGVYLFSEDGEVRLIPFNNVFGLQYAPQEQKDG